MEEAAKHGWETYGIEPSEPATRFRNTTLNVCLGPLASPTCPAKSFQLLTLWDVIGHLPNPLQALLTARDLVSDDGLIVIKTPNYSAGSLLVGRAVSQVNGTRGWMHLPAQLFHFSKTPLISLLTRDGFEVVEFNEVQEPLGLDTVSFWRKPRLMAAQLLRAALRCFGH